MMGVTRDWPARTTGYEETAPPSWYDAYARRVKAASVGGWDEGFRDGSRAEGTKERRGRGGSGPDRSPRGIRGIRTIHDLMTGAQSGRDYALSVQPGVITGDMLSAVALLRQHRGLPLYNDARPTSRRARPTARRGAGEVGRDDTDAVNIRPTIVAPRRIPTLGVRVSPSMRVTLRRLAAGRSMSAYVRDLLLQHVSRATKGPA